MSRFTALAILLLFLSGCGHHLYHRIERGETLYSVSWEYGYDYKQVAQWNGIAAPYQVKPGQIIHLSPPQREVSRGLLARSYEPVIADMNPPKRSEAQTRASKDLPATRSTSSRVVVKDTDAKLTSRAEPKVSGSVVQQKTKVFKQESYHSGAIVWRWPTEGRVIANFKSASDKHQGLDIAGRSGQAVRAAANGMVVYSGNGLKGYGNLIIIKHDDRYLSAYAHNRDIFVAEGDVVKVGQKIAEMGNTDRESVALHFQIRDDGKPVDPNRYLPKR